MNGVVDQLPERQRPSDHAQDNRDDERPQGLGLARANNRGGPLLVCAATARGYTVRPGGWTSLGSTAVATMTLFPAATETRTELTGFPAASVTRTVAWALPRFTVAEPPASVIPEPLDPGTGVESSGSPPHPPRTTARKTGSSLRARSHPPHAEDESGSGGLTNPMFLASPLQVGPTASRYIDHHSAAFKGSKAPGKRSSQESTQ